LTTSTGPATISNLLQANNLTSSGSNTSITASNSSHAISTPIQILNMDQVAKIDPSNTSIIKIPSAIPIQHIQDLNGSPSIVLNTQFIPLSPACSSSNSSMSALNNSLIGTQLSATTVANPPPKRFRKNSTSPTVNETLNNNNNGKSSKNITKTAEVFFWPEYLEKHNAIAAPVSAFKHAPLSDYWTRVSLNLQVEVPNRDPPPDDTYDVMIESNDPANDLLHRKKLYWFASIVQIAGYWIKLRYLGYEDDSSQDFWTHFCDSDVHHLGWSTENGHILVPPNGIICKQNDWIAYIHNRITGHKTLGNNFYKIVIFNQILVTIS
jgi:hypothetical protein